MWRRVLIGVLVLASVATLGARTILDVQAFLHAPPHGVGGGSMALRQLISTLPALGWTVSGGVLAGRRPRNALGWLFLACGLLLSGALLLGAAGRSYLDDTSWQLELALTLGFVPLLAVPTVILALYPDGRLPARWWSWPVGVAIAGIVLLCGIPVLLPGVADPARRLLVFPIAAATATIVVATFVRWRRAVYPYRQQLAWFAGCGVVSYVCYVLAGFAYASLRIQGLALVVLLTDPMLVIPIGVAVGVLRYHLLGIKAVLRRGLVYGTLTVLVVTVYFLVTAGLGTVLDDKPLPGVVAAAIVAAGLAPARDRLQRAADRLVYGARRDPLQALAELSDSVAADRLDPVPAAVATVITAVRATGAVIIAPDRKVLARAGAEPERYLALPLRFGGAEIGELRVAEPAEGRYSQDDLRLLTALAAQLAVVISATDLTEALEAERVRVVTATRDERDRLRRDLHDGLGPSLTGMSLGLQALSGMLSNGAAGDAGALVQRLRAETDTAVRDIRRIIDGLRPTVLDTAGLTQAVQRHAGTLDAALPVDVRAGTLPVLAPDVEVTAYRIITEALTNAARHAHARQARVTIDADEALHIAVSDDGCGIDADRTEGVGLSSMRRRAEALGGGLAVHSGDGGTTVTATLPLSS
ncbi:GAF domain-containing protein [Actinoplanes sp. TBRC 11911]|uniref:sensor histidine kinase n=1 Tax=Actinoplanes sp. TBRC 11911 TaxID=2729386 RepID=UPI00145EF4FE|nr:ATP-binding protein [Actinoplanes sp. TBRC 11911]NMO53964.1 GAF domain-containing protein [Actinoplanes sp. TBRC 11911]